MSWIVVGLVILVGLLLSGFFSGAETGLYRVNRLRLQLAVQGGDARAARVAGVVGDEQGALCVTLVGTNLMNYVTTTAVAYLLADMLRFAETDAQLYTVVMLTPVIFVFGEVVPKNLFQLYADTLLARFSWLFAASNRLLRVIGIVWVLRQLTGLVNRAVGTRSASDRIIEPKWRVALLLQEELAGRRLGEDRSELIDRVCRLSETPLRAVMLPLSRVTSISATADRRELIGVAWATGYARLPVHGKRRFRIEGIVKIDDLLRSDDWETVGERLAPALHLRPVDTVATAIAGMRAARREMAIVTDHGGNLSGIVTLRDLLEEVVGDVNAER